MVEIIYKPIKRIVILEITKFSLEHLTKNLAVLIRGGQPAALAWAEEVAFHHVPIPPTTNKLIEKFLNGIVYWSSVQYALMPEYKPKVTVSAPELGTVEIPVIDVSPNPILREVCAWLKKRSL